MVGAQPNFVKTAPVISDRSQIGQHRRIPDGRYALIHTGQHNDSTMIDSPVAMEERFRDMKFTAKPDGVTEGVNHG